MAKVIDPETIEPRAATNYPSELAAAVTGRQKRGLTVELGLSQFGVNLTTLAPGAASAHRHWHVSEDEFCYILAGKVTLVTDEGEQILTPGMAIGFPANDGNGHHLINKSSAPVTFLEVGTRAQVDLVSYPDVDMLLSKLGGKWTVRHKDGRPWE